MKRTALGLSLFVGLGLVAAISGCANLIPPLPVEFPLDAANGGLQFAVTAGEPTQRTAVLTFNPNGVAVSGGNFELKPSAITIEPAAGGPGKGNVNFQGGVVSVIGRVTLPDQQDAVCDSTDEYGPYEVTFDDAFTVTAVNPATITLSQNTLDALDTGMVTICLEITAPFDGTITISTLTFNVSVSLN